ncbi:MAG TPA: DNA polymerase IV [Acholeplasmataceae bacterium]|nr:DNA polymerase IV [Acholeplasmataceae bacterium]
MNKAKIIFHIDMNCFFASCERAENKDLIGKPIAVAHQDPLYRGIILSPSYEARKYGIKTTMLVRDALLLCHDLIIIEPKMHLYKEYSKRFFEYLYSITPQIEVASIDEGYLDVSENSKTEHPLELAKRIQDYLLDKYNLPCSIGIGPNKFLAKMGSNLKKPLGITVLRKREIDIYLWPLPIESMYGVGKKTAPKLRAIGINTIGDLAQFKNFELLKETVGEAAANSLISRANGNGSTELMVGETDNLSVSNAHTFDNPVFDLTLVKETLKVIANTVSHRLERQGKQAQTIGLILKYPDLRQINRSQSLEIASSNPGEIYDIAEEILEDVFEPGDQIRLVGISATRLRNAREEVKQFSIFDNISEIDREEQIRKLLRSVKKNFGENSIKRGYYEYKGK